MKFSLPGSRGRSGSGGGWIPAMPERGMSHEQEQLLAGDDLAQLLAATNAKRLARGKPELTASDVELRVFFEEQQAQRSGER